MPTGVVAAVLTRRLVPASIGLVASAIAIFLVMRSVDLAATGAAIASASPGPLVASVALVGVTMLLRSWRWQRLLPVAVPVLRILPVVLVGYLGNAVLPARLGEPIRAYLLARRENLSSAAVFGTVVLERIVDVATLAAMAFAATWLVDAPTWAVQLTGVAAIGSAAVLGLLTFVGVWPLVRLLHRVTRGGRATLVRGAIGPIERFAQGVGSRAQRTGVIQAVAISVPVWVVDACICLLVGQSLGIHLGLAESLVIVAVGAVGTTIPAAPGYVGTYELAVSTAATAFGIDASAALGLAVLLHAVTLLPVVIAGSIALVRMGVGGLLAVARASALERESTR